MRFRSRTEIRSNRYLTLLREGLGAAFLTLKPADLMSASWRDRLPPTGSGDTMRPSTSAADRPAMSPDSTPNASMDTATAFAAVALAAVSWDGVLTMAGTRALRHALDYRPPFRERSDAEMIALMDRLLRALRERGAGGLMVDAADVLDERQRHTAYAVAAEIMRSDGPLQEQEREILASLAEHLRLEAAETTKVGEVMEVLHASIVEPAVPA